MITPPAPEPGRLTSIIESYLEGAAYRSLVSTSAEDIAGAEAAGQNGLLFHAARSTARQAVLAFLAEHGVVVSAHTDVGVELTRLGPRWARAAEIYARVEAGNPIDDIEIRAYVDECRRFCASVGVRIQRGAFGRDVEDLPTAMQSGASELHSLLSILRPDADLTHAVQDAGERLQPPKLW